MKSLARQNVWWPSINSDIELRVKQCEPCQMVNFKPSTSVTTPWPKATSPWERVHLDYFQYDSRSFLILEDAFSRWIDEWPVKSTNAETLCEKLRLHIAVFGTITEIVTDNGPPFDSTEFLNFCTEYGTYPVKSPPYHPQSNGLAERAVQTVKKALKKLVLEARQSSQPYKLNQMLASYLFSYRNTPTTVTNQSPSQLILKTPPRTRLSLLNPKTEKHKIKHLPKFEEGDQVLVRMNKVMHKATIAKQLSPMTYYVNINGIVKLCHLNQLKLSVLSDYKKSATAEAVNHPPQPVRQTPQIVNQPPLNVIQPPQQEMQAPQPAQPEQLVVQPPQPIVQPPRRSSRVRKAPERLNL